MNMNTVADAFNNEIGIRAKCTAAIESNEGQSNLVIRRTQDNEKMIIMAPNGFIAIMPGNKRHRAAKRLIFLLRCRYQDA